MEENGTTETTLKSTKVVHKKRRVKKINRTAIISFQTNDNFEIC